MRYSESYNALKTVFNQKSHEIQRISPDCMIRQFHFTSKPSPLAESTAFVQPMSLILPCSEDALIRENCEFTYPVFIPGNSAPFDRALILLHGLNERCWTKYLAWARRLAEGLQRPVILFPISFHMNRSPAEWSNPRLMSAIQANTRLRNRRNHSSTFANLALSLRLSVQPLRFFTSGSQSARDLETLITTIQTGEHLLFAKGAKTDFFAYSIGAFLAQIMMLTFGTSLLSDSRLFMFCGGAPFNRMNGVSKLIMDEEAYMRLRFYYLNQFEGDLQSKEYLAGLPDSEPSARAFRAMLAADRLSGWRNNQFDKMKDRIRAIALKNDRIIPSAGIAEILTPEQLEVIDYSADYSHENPFPVTGRKEVVDYNFELVFRQAEAFLR